MTKWTVTEEGGSAFVSGYLLSVYRRGDGMFVARVDRKACSGGWESEPFDSADDAMAAAERELVAIREDPARRLALWPKRHGDSAMNVRVKRMHPDAKLPAYAHPGDAGMDLFARLPDSGICMLSHSRATIDTGVAFEIPDGYVGLVLPRSGLARKGLLAATGVIDSSYRGAVGVTLYAGDDEHYIETGDKIAQMVIVPCPRVTLVESDYLSDTTRGSSGFGSTGR